MSFISKDNSADPRKLSRLVFYILGIIAAYTAMHTGGFREIPQWVVYFTTTFLFLLLLVNTKRVIYIPKGPLLCSWCALIIWMSISTIFSADPNTSVGYILLLSGLLFGALLSFALANTESETDRFVGILLLGAAVVTVYGWVVYFIGKYTVVGGHEMIRHFIGPFYLKNPMGGYLILLLPLALAGILKFEKIWAWLSAILSILMIGGLILTRSRGSWIAFGLTALIIFLPSLIIHRISKGKWFALAAVLLCGFLIGIAFAPPNELEQRLRSIATSASPEVEGQSAMERVAMLKAGVEIVKDYPIFGVGPNCWPVIRSPYMSELRIVPKYAHNLYLRTAAEIGIPGILLFLFALALTYLPLMRDSYRKGMSIFVPAIACGTGASLLHMAVDFDSAFAGIMLPLALLLGLGQRERHRAKLGLPRLRYGKSAAILLVSVLGILIITRGISYVKLQDGRDYYSMMEYDRAQTSFKMATVLNPVSWEARLDYSNLLAELGEIDEAYAYGLAAANLAPTIPEVQRNMGYLHAAVGDTQKAIQHYKNSIALSPKTSAERYFELAELYSAYGDRESSVNTLLLMTSNLSPYAGKSYTDQTVSFKYNLAEAWRKLAEEYIAMGDTVNAIHAVEKSEEYAQLREKDFPYALMGIDALSPEMVVFNFFEALNSEDTMALRETVFDQEHPVPRVSEGIVLEFDRVIRIYENPLAGTAKVEFIMLRSDSLMTAKIPASFDMTFARGGWKIVFSREE